MTTSTVPPVIAALVSLARTVVPAGVVVYDGPPTEPLADRYLSIGYSANEDNAAVDGSTEDMGNYLSAESYLVRCQASAFTGDMDPDATGRQRQVVSTIHMAFVAAVRANPTLSGALVPPGRAVDGRWSWIYGPLVDGGNGATVEFDIAVDAAYLGAT